MSKKKKIKKKQKGNFRLKRNVRFDSLNPAKSPKVRKELLDADYLDQLSPEELRWYAQFTDEWAGAAVHKNKAGKVKSGYLHNTEALAKSVYDANNKRNNDVLGVSKANNLLRTINMNPSLNDDDKEVDDIYDTSIVEQALNAKIDEENRLKRIIENDEIDDKSENDIFLTKIEFQRLIRHGAKIPDAMMKFYTNYYKLK